MSQRLRQVLHHDERGIAMALVVLALLIVSILIGVMFQTVLAEQTATRSERNVTNARQAAEAGVDEVVFKLDQGTAFSDANVTQANAVHYPTTGTTAVGKGSYSALVWADPNNTNNRFIQATGTFSTNKRTLLVKVTLTQPGLNYAMYAANDINFHNHGGPLSISVSTNDIYAGGDITVNYPSQFRLNTMTAQGTIKLSDGGGDASKVNSGAGYAWSYDLPPLGNTPPDTARSCWPGYALGAGDGTTANNLLTGPSPGSCTGSPKTYSPNSTVMGNLEAGSVTIDGHGNTLPGLAATTQTGQPLDVTSGDVHAGSATVNGHAYAAGTYAAGGACADCGVGSSAHGGQISGTLKVESGFAPTVVPFPDIDYSKYQAAATAQSAGITCGQIPATNPVSNIVQHCFSSGTGGNTFVSYITSVDANHNLYQTVDPTTGTMSAWPAGASNDPAAVKMPDVIFLDGDWYITGDDLTLANSAIAANARAAACAQQAARGQASCSIPAVGTPGAPDPYIVVRGSLIVATGGLTLTQGLIVVGPHNATNFLYKPSCCNGQGANPNVPFQVDVSKFLSSDSSGTPATSGLLGVGTKIDAKDADQDVQNNSPWTGGTYTMGTAAPAFLRGVIVNATWNGTHLVPGQEQHWHVFDPKNIMRLYGAEIGGKLHNCNNFQFTYDPIVKGVRFQPGGSGTVSVLDYQEIKNP